MTVSLRPGSALMEKEEKQKRNSRAVLPSPLFSFLSGARTHTRARSLHRGPHPDGLPGALLERRGWQQWVQLFLICLTLKICLKLNLGSIFSRWNWSNKSIWLPENSSKLCRQPRIILCIFVFHLMWQNVVQEKIWWSLFSFCCIIAWSNHPWRSFECS